MLIAEDNDINRQLLREILIDEYEVLEAADGREALELMKQDSERISAVLLDIVMPVLDGYGVLKEMRSDETLSRIPVIVTTASTDVGAEVKALSLGAKDFVIKPYNPQIIKHRLRNTIKLRETAAIINATKHNALTGLYSRSTFFEKATAMLREQEAGYYVMVGFDIDNFKVINDQYGNHKGDEVLKFIADTIHDGVELLGGICCRITADNFALIYPACHIDTEPIKKMWNAVIALDGSIMPITFSTGRYIAEDLSLSANAMYDRALIAKASIKGRYDVHVAYFDESMRERILHDQEITSEMNIALTAGQFETWLQPQYNHATGALIGAEALVRWRHPKKGIISPGEFIPVFEKNGFIYEMDKYIWEQVCILLRSWIDEGLEPLPVSVNISRYDVFRDDLYDKLTGLIEKYHIPVDLLRLEMTESAFAQSTGQIIDVVKALVDFGFTVEIDDFGSGYSSLNTLKDVPAQVVKLDMKFLEDENNSDRGGNIIESVIRMIRWLGMSVIAEGVETMEQADYLCTIGCCYVQGYLYAKPMNVQEYVQLSASCVKEERKLALETVETLDQNTFWNPKSLDTIIFNSYVGGACIFEYFHGKLEILRVNKRYATEISGVESAIEEALKIDIAQFMDAQNLEKLHQNIRNAIEGWNESSCEVKLSDLPNRQGETYLYVTVRAIAKAGEHLLLYGTINDVTSQRVAEKREYETKEMLQTIMDHINSGVTAVTIDEDGEVRFVFANDQFYHILGYTREQYEEELDNVFDAVYMEDLDRIKVAIREAMQTQGSTVYEYRCIRRDGEIISIRCNSTVTSMGGFGNHILLSVMYDITEQKAEYNKTKSRYAHELKLRQGLLRDSIIYYEINLSNRLITEYSSIVNDVSGLEAGSVVNDDIENRILENIVEEDRKVAKNTIFTDALYEAYQHGETNVSLEYRRIMSKSGTRWVRAYATMMKSPDTEDAIAFLYIKNIDMPKKNQIALGTIVDEEFESVVIVNVKSGLAHFAKTRKDFSNLEEGQIFHYDKYIVEYNLPRILPEEQDDYLKFIMLDGLVQALKTDVAAVYAYQVKNQSNQIVRKRTHAFYLDNRKEDIVLLRRDITDIIKDEEQRKQVLQDAVDTANKANQAKSDFLSRMSHDMRTPMNAIIGMVRLAKDEQDIEQLKEYLDNIDSSSHFLLGLINDILDISRIESGKIDLFEEPYTLEEFTRNVKTVIQPLMDAKDLDFVFKMDAGIGSILVDKLRFSQVFFNLLSNAVKYTDSGGRVEFLEQKISDENDKNGVRFIVRDNGRGMSEEFLKEIFEPFSQERMKNDTNEQSSGLGLAIAKRLVEAMGGTIRVSSKIGEGTEFVVELYACINVKSEERSSRIVKEYPCLQGFIFCW